MGLPGRAQQLTRSPLVRLAVLIAASNAVLAGVASTAGAVVVVDRATHQRFGVVPAFRDHGAGSGATAPGATSLSQLRRSSAAAPSSSSCAAPCNLTWHNGPVQHGETDYLIWWVPTGFPTPSTGQPYRQGMANWLSDVAAADGASSNPFSVMTQYYDHSGTGGTNSYVPNAMQSAGLINDADPYPVPNNCTDRDSLGNPMVYCLTDTDIQTELTSYITLHHLPTGINVEYFVLTPPTVGACMDGTANSDCSYLGNGTGGGFCGYHRASSMLTSTEIVYAVIPWDYQVPGCDINLQNWNPAPGYPNSTFIDSGVSVLSHELSETTTDPNLNAWYDGNGEEIGDKCAYNYGATAGPDSVAGLISNGNGYWNFQLGSDVYLLQLEWDNAHATCAASLAQPASTSAPTISGTAIQAQTLTESSGSWSPAAAHYDYQWEDCDSTGVRCSAIPGATNQTYTLATTDVGHTIRVQELASGSSTPASSSPTSVVLPLPPSSTRAPTVSGGAGQGQTLTEAHGSWLNSPTTYSYQWEHCDRSGANCSAISGARAQTYVLQAGDAGLTIRVQETASNAGGSGAPATSSASSVVLPLAPSSAGAPAISGTPTEGQTLSELHGSWSNGPTGFIYQWEDCDSSGAGCSAIGRATGQTYALRTADVGHTVRVLETASNAGGVGATVSSAASALVGASRQHVVAALSSGLIPSRFEAGVARVLKSNGYTLSFNAPSAGLLRISWRAGSVLVAKLSLSIRAAGARPVSLALTRAGRALLTRSKRVRIVCTATFTPNGAGPITTTKSFKLSR